MFIAHVGSRLAKQIRVGIDCLQDARQNQQELDVVVRKLTGIEHVDAVIRAERPVVVLTGTGETGERLLAEQTGQSSAVRNLLHGLHDELVVVDRDICRRVDGRELMLRGSHLVMLGLRGHTELPKLRVQFLHETAHALTDLTEIVVLHVVCLRRNRAEQGASREDQVVSLQPLLTIDQEVLLLGAHHRGHLLRSSISEQAQDTQCLCI